MGHVIRCLLGREPEEMKTGVGFTGKTTTTGGYFMSVYDYCPWILIPWDDVDVVGWRVHGRPVCSPFSFALTCEEDCVAFIVIYVFMELNGAGQNLPEGQK